VSRHVTGVTFSHPRHISTSQNMCAFFSSRAPLRLNPLDHGHSYRVAPIATSLLTKSVCHPPSCKPERPRVLLASLSRSHAQTPRDDQRACTAPCANFGSSTTNFLSEGFSVRGATSLQSHHMPFLPRLQVGSPQSIPWLES
jgi:hypothetical protein